jgi:hypothetical protein
METAITVVPIVVSIIALAFSVSANQRSWTIALRPTLGFVYDRETGWSVQNLGNGPAFDITVAQFQPGNGWFNPVRIPPLSRDTQFPLGWLEHANDCDIGCTYSDTQGRMYSSRCSNDLSTVAVGRKLPTWPDGDIARHWDPPEWTDRDSRQPPLEVW